MSTGNHLAGRPRSVASEVAAHLERLIATELKPGDKLPPEREVADRLGVSRTSVRDAMAELARRRLVERAPGRGTTVLAPDARSAQMTDLDPDERSAADVAELRSLIEPSVAALAALRRSDSDLLQLEQVLADSPRRLSPERSLQQDTAFHSLLAHASGNPLLVSLSDLVGRWSADVRRRSHLTEVGRTLSVRGHHAILHAVAAGEPEAATAAMTAHLQEVAAMIVTHQEHR